MYRKGYYLVQIKVIQYFKLGVRLSGYGYVKW